MVVMVERRLRARKLKNVVYLRLVATSQTLELVFHRVQLVSGGRRDRGTGSTHGSSDGREQGLPGPLALHHQTKRLTASNYRELKQEQKMLRKG